MTFLFMIRRFLKHKPYKQNSIALDKAKRDYLQKANPIKHPFYPGEIKKVKIKTRQLLWYVNDITCFHSNPMLTNSSAYHQLWYFLLGLFLMTTLFSGGAGSVMLSSPAVLS